MKSLNNPNPNPVKSEISDLDKFLGGYTSPMKINTDLNAEQSGAINNNGVNKPVENILSRVDQAVYKTGKKAGQPKPNRGNQSTVHSPLTTDKKEPVVKSVLITGAMFIMIIDFLFPMIIAFIHNRTSKTKVEAVKIKLTEAQKTELEPAGKAVVEYLNLSANPIVFLLIGLGGAYSMSYMMEKSRVELEKRTVKSNPYDKK